MNCCSKYVLASTALGTFFFSVLPGGALGLLRSAQRIFLEFQERRRVREGQCPVCRYDIRYTMAPGCPECGWGRLPPKLPDSSA